MNFSLGHINKIASISVVLKEDGHYFNVVILKQKKGLLEIVKKEKHISTVKELLKYVGNYTSFILHFTGKGILNRKLDNQPNCHAGMLFDANFDDFYFTDVVGDKYIMSSMIRKSVIKEIIGLFNVKLNHIISISTGPFISSVLSSQLNTKSIVVDDYVIEIENQNISNFSKKEDNLVKNYPLGDKMIDHKELSAVAHASEFFNPSESVILPNDTNIFVVAKKESEQKNIFVRFGAGMILFYLAVLLANMMYLDNLQKKIAHNYEELSLSELTLKQIGFLKEEKSRKEKLLSSSGLLNEKFLSYYLMELSNSVPKEISFIRVSIRPYINEIKKNFKIEIDDNVIYITGESISSSLLSEWINKIERKDWIGKIDILSYVYAKGRGEFELKIEIINV